MTQLQELTSLGWPAVETQQIGDWTVRFSSGITRRANSVIAAGMPDDRGALDQAVDEVERRSAERWLDPTFQLWQPPEETSEDDQADEFFAGQERLADLLDGRGYQVAAPTRVLWMARRGFPPESEWDRSIQVSETLEDDWLAAYAPSTSDVDPASRLVHRRLLSGGRSRFYTALDADGAIGGVAKVSLVTPADTDQTFAGIYAFWVREDLRGQGVSAALLDAIFNHLVRLGVAGCWLQVEERSARALSVYRAAGFSTVARYRYLTHPH